ncbi:ubiquinol-cytochrome C chaperone family protein [Aurantimonas marina]|uniref:ubiquinol-cytochrome C chaperone family protein n=1 Tax=Aurantimonas marina TaxID=2780508 RepID=UPI0019D1E736|nr:ubiquinol-cytochrome C chaperone family protein [Aurantimonas marina]
MFERLRTNRRNREVVERLYGELVALARRPELYLEHGVPDTVMGRFDALSIHVFLFLQRCREEPALQPIAQDVVDRFIIDVEQSIRELGVGDPSVPKRMRKLAGIFYERVAAYDAALDGSQAPIAHLAATLQARVVPAEAGRGVALQLATYIAGMRTRLQATTATAILAGHIETDELGGAV